MDDFVFTSGLRIDLLQRYSDCLFYLKLCKRTRLTSKRISMLCLDQLSDYVLELGRNYSMDCYSGPTHCGLLRV